MFFQNLKEFFIIENTEIIEDNDYINQIPESSTIQNMLGSMSNNGIHASESNSNNDSNYENDGENSNIIRSFQPSSKSSGGKHIKVKVDDR